MMVALALVLAGELVDELFPVRRGRYRSQIFVVAYLVRPLYLCRGPDTGEFTITAVTACAVLVWPRGAGDGLVEPFPG